MRSLWIAGIVVLVDQSSKWLVREKMALGESIPVLGSFFRLTYIHNPGAVFGLQLGGKGLHLLFAGGALILVGVMLWRLPAKERVTATGLALVLGGAIGNVMDRIGVLGEYGVVIDFLDFGVGSLRWWVFNLADACVTTGAGLLILTYGFQRQDEGEIDGDGDSPRP